MRIRVLVEDDSPLLRFSLGGLRGTRGKKMETREEMKFLIDKSTQGAKETKNGEGTTVVVGIKLDDGSKELLTWALVNVAQAGDRVIALHVLSSTAEVPDSNGELSSLISIVNALNDVLSVYEGFCNLKQIDLKLKISRGSSIRKVLIQEANSVSASKLIVGVSKSTAQGFSYYSLSVAKYCAKKLSGGCLVLAVKDGKIIFQNEVAGDISTDDLFLLSSFVRPLKINEQLEKDTDPARRSFHCLAAAFKARLGYDKISSYTANLSSRFNFLKNENCPSFESVSVPLSSPVSYRRCHTSCEYGEESFNAIPMKGHESPSGCVPILICELPQRRPGWTFLRRAYLSHKKNSSQANQKASVGHLAMQLPSRYSTLSAVHPDSRQAKSDAVARFCCNGIAPLIPCFEVDDEAKDLPKELLSLQEKYSSVCRLFRYMELKHATSNFSPENIIGKGGNSRVYKGCLPDSKELAVKILEPSDDVLKNFILEIEIMSNLHHNNIISLTGFCFENNRLMLVYDFLTRGSLENNLHGVKGGRNGIGWAERYKIAVGVAEALEYLHESGSCAQPVIHRDVKSSNILLSDDFVPKLSDFGLAQLALSCIKNTPSSDLAGTFGYIAPECFMYGKVDEKVDVYAFGVVLLELLSGRKPVCTDCPKGEESLVQWAKPMLRGWKLEQVLDPCLGSNYNPDEMERTCLAAFLCIREAPVYRPSIPLVVKLLKGDDDAVKWAKLELGASMVPDGMDDEATTRNLNIQSHINLALLGIDDSDALSTSSIAHSVNFLTSNTSLEDYLKERWSRSSSFN